MSSISTKTEKQYYFSRSFLRDTIYGPSAEDTLLNIDIHLIKQRHSWSEPHTEANICETSFDEVKIWIPYSSPNHRRAYSDCFSSQMSELGVPLEQHPPILDKLFQIVPTAVSGSHSILVIAEVTLRLSDSFDAHDISRLISECPISIEIGYALSELDYHGDPDRVVPATITSIVSLLNNKLRVEDLDGATMKQHPSCAICMDDFGVELILPLPCAHYYHVDCIVPWLRTSHLCPRCRYPMPTL